jgi:hypothetical protein
LAYLLIKEEKIFDSNRDVSNYNQEIDMKVINPTSAFKGYMAIQIRYLKYICSIKGIDMLTATEGYSYGFKSLYLQKHVY